MANEVKRLKLGEHLLAMGAIDQSTLDNALKSQKLRHESLSKILMEVVDEKSIAEAFASQVNVAVVQLTEEEITPAILALIPANIALKHTVIPLRKTDKGLLVAFANPLAPEAIDELSFITGKQIESVVAVKSDILNALTLHYGISQEEDTEGQLPIRQTGIEIVRSGAKSTVEEEEIDLKKLENLAKLAPVVRFLNATLTDAITQRASDIHIEPGKTKVTIRYRIDGILRDAMTTEPHVHLTLVSRIKIIADMDISIRRKPQDGKAQIRLNGKAYDLRISTIPTTFGEKVTMRILDSAMAGIGIEDIGFSADNLKMMSEAVDSPQGIVLVTGPTGSGKSSTLYACLNHLKSPTVNIITLEDPVEYEMAGINQVSINVKAGLTFASGLRTILRQDPDIVMIGEIRDGETAEIACKASQTGHFVLSTLHTNDAPSTISRLMDLGIEPFMISSSLRAVVGQRLVRRICTHCKIAAEVPDQYAKRITSYLAEHSGATFWKGTGCSQCKSSGYSGRVAIHEVMTMTPELKETLVPGVSVFALKKAARNGGYRPLTLDGLDKAREGLTSLEEIFRVSPPEIDVSDIEANKDHAGQRAVAPEVLDEAFQARNEEGPIKVLIVDDDTMARKILHVNLKAKGFEVVEAINGVDGLKKVFTEKPDIILTDYLMPEMDGLGLVRQLKSRDDVRHIPIIMLTSKDEAESEIELMDAGVDDYLTKPVNADRLLARMGRLLR